MFSMKRSILLLATISAGALFFGPAAMAEAPTGSADTAKSEKPASTPRPNPSLPLKKGMTAQDVKEHWGEPASVEPFRAKGEKAEIWTYYYTLSDQVTQAMTGTRMVTVYRGIGQDMGEVSEPVYGMKRTEVTQVVKLLFYDGELVSWKKAVEQKETLQ
jgi:outer membrane protein assembly factor BamE (lipoprotein component of BamABCDE complex)